MKYVISLAIMVYFALLIILVLNITDKSKIIKYSFVIFMISLIISLFFINEIVMDYLISLVIRYLYFPTFASILATVVAAIVVFLLNIFHDTNKDKVRIINYIFASFILIAYIIYMTLNIDINSPNALYEGDSLLLLRYISRTGTLWFIISLCIKYYEFFFKKRRVL